MCDNQVRENAEEVTRLWGRDMTISQSPMVSRRALSMASGLSLLDALTACRRTSSGGVLGRNTCKVRGILEENGGVSEGLQRN